MDNEIIKLELTLAQVNQILTVLGEVALVKAIDPVNWIREQAIPQHAELIKKYPEESSEK